MTFSEKEILEQLDLPLAIKPGSSEVREGIPSKYYPKGRPQDIKYNFFLDLEDGYRFCAGNKIHLYADSTRWAIVFEQNGYHTRGNKANISLYYFGNCINYPVSKHPERNYITNRNDITLIESSEFERIENKIGLEMETFELIGSQIEKIAIRDTFVKFDNDYRNYKKLGIKIRDYDNSNNLIGFENLIRYLHETSSTLINATEPEIQKHMPKDLPKLMSIDKFHFQSIYEEANPTPSQQETYQLIAKVLVTKDTANWKPTKKPNNSWKNWDSGSL